MISVSRKPKPRSGLLLCLSLLLLASIPAGSNSPNDASSVGIDEEKGDDDKAVVLDLDIPLDDGDGAHNTSASAASRITSEAANISISSANSASVSRKPAFLRKNDKNEVVPPKKGKGREIFQKALNRAIGGGVPGAIAGVVQVLSLMWLRTVINYQYRYGSTFLQALTTLYGMGGIPRLYSGLPFALIQAPLSRFISTAANDGVSVLLQNLNWGPGREVVVAAFVVGFFRMMLMPIDTCKTVLQIESKKGLSQLMAKVWRGQVHLLYSGAFANAASSFIGHYPWFYVYNLLSRSETLIQSIPWTTVRNALIGFISSIVSDTVANFMRVIKTTKQALGSTRSGTTYAETVGLILAVDGWRGLFGRGLKTRILGNALQSILFTVIWRSLSERWHEEKPDHGSVESNTQQNDRNAQNAEYEKAAR